MSDLIERLTVCANGAFTVSEAATIREAIEVLSHSVYRWVPVSERTPEHRGDVLVTDGSLIGIGDCCKGHLWNSQGTNGVTHWMPLPERPVAPCKGCNATPCHCDLMDPCAAARRGGYEEA